jgi:hypothetical protein
MLTLAELDAFHFHVFESRPAFLLYIENLSVHMCPASPSDADYRSVYITGLPKTTDLAFERLDEVFAPF